MGQQDEKKISCIYHYASVVFLYRTDSAFVVPVRHLRLYLSCLLSLYKMKYI